MVAATTVAAVAKDAAVNTVAAAATVVATAEVAVAIGAEIVVVAVETAIGAVTAEAVVTGAIENKRFSLKIDLDQKPSARLFVQEAFLLLGN